MLQVLADGAIGSPHQVIAHHHERLDLRRQRHRDLSLGGGVIADLGVYGLSLAVDVLGPAQLTAAAGVVAPAGLDLSATILLEHVSGGRSTIQAGMNTAGPNRASVVGSHGWIELEPYWFTGSGFTVFDGGRPEREQHRWKPLGDDAGLHHQVLEVERCLAEGKQASAVMPLSTSIAVMELVDAARAALGRSAADHPRRDRIAS